ncbi:MAG: hypothetical protein OEV35_02365 [Gallionellaceae bacterium]|nr:hypothetical protein [Gallionellaceae bacterium]
MNWHLVLRAFMHVAASGVILLGSNAQAASLGRLFFTPEQRAQLEQDHIKNRAAWNKGAELRKQKEAGIGGKKGEVSVLIVNGIVQKHGGPRTVWINGVAQDADSSGERAPEAHMVALPGKTQSARLKVGQKLLLEKPPSAELSQEKQERQKPMAADGNDD